MNKAVFLSLLFFISISLNISAQKPIRCYSDEKTELLKKLDPEYYKSLQEPILLNHQSRQMMMIVTIPVHVIIVHPPGQQVGSGVNFSMDHILSQIDVLNEDFRRLNPDAGNTPQEFAADDSEIEFCMASVDPSGNPTDGVTRYGTTQNLNNDEFAIKSATGWDRNNYLNIWVGPGLGGILGWAYLPTTGGLPNATLDGVVIASGTFGGPGYGTTNNYDLGRTASHEVGHYLGLRHIWRSNGCGLDDGFPDTPLQDDENYGCPNHPSPSCGNAGDMFMNYMDYVYDNCMNAFTTDQGNYMHDILNTSRSSLLDAANTYCDVGGVPLVLELVTTIDVLCFGESTGAITVQASGGTAPYTYAIDNGSYQNNNTFTGVAAGTHIVSAQDDFGTTIDIEVLINEPPQLIPVIDLQENVSCFGDEDGVVIVSATGGTPPPGDIYLYNIDGGTFSPNNIFDNLDAGPHTIIVQDANGCESPIDAFIFEPEELFTFPDNILNVTCFGENNGMVSVISIGGNPSYTYSIDQINYQSAPVFFDLAPGNYLMSTLDQNGCTAETVFSISEPDLLEMNVLQTQPVLCFGESSGSITLEAFGGTSNYEYSIDGVNYQPNPFFDNLSASTYLLSVLDANDCYTDINVTLDDPEELVLELIDQTSAGCAGQTNGTMTLTSTGGTGGNTFIYDTQTLTGDTVTFENLPAGTLTVMVEDDNACSTEMEIEVLESAAIELETVNLENVSCENTMDGLIEVQATGGSGVYSYSLNSGAYGPENIFTGLAPGGYTVSVLDDAGCEEIIVLFVTAPDPITTEIESLSNPDCFGMSTGSVDVAASGGTGGFNYILDAETNSTGIFNDLSAGTYQIIAIDENDCSEEITIEIDQPEEVQITEVSNEPVDCFGNNSGSFIVNASGGNNTFEYILNAETNNTGEFNDLSAGIYTVIATDGNGCSETLEVTVEEPIVLEVSIDYISDVSCAGEASGLIQLQAGGGSGTITYTLGAESNNTGLFENLMEGSYTIDVVDENACNTNITAVVASTPELEIAEENLSPVSCFGEQDGFIQLIVSGGNGSFDFTLGAETNNTGLFENLSPGIYSAIVTDGSGCSGTYDFEISEPDELETGVDAIMDVSCFGGIDGIAELIVLGGTGPFTFDNGITSNNDGSFIDLEAGLYQFTVTDENGCTAMTEATIDQPTELEATITETQDVGCNGMNNGSFVITATGGSGIFTFTANNETNTSGEFTNLIAGNYPVTIIDDNDCETSIAVEIAEVPAIVLEVVETNMNNCFGETIGNIQAAASGGSGALEYTLDNETNTSGYFENLAAGDYEIQVTDTSGCSNTILQNISEPAELQPEVTEIQQNNCFGNAEGSVQLTTSGGTGTLEYTLGGQTNNNGLFENLAAGDYEIMITDENNCSAVQSVNITEPEVLESEIIDLQNIDCTGSGTGSVTAQASGGNGGYVFTLDTETNSTGVFSDLPAGNYEIQIVDANGCETAQAFEIVAAANLDVAIEETQGINCYGEASGALQISAGGGSGNYEFWLDGQMNTSGLFEGLTGGVYEISVIDQDGCTDVSEYQINQPDAIESEILATQNPACFGETGSVQVSTQGGNGAFEYTLNNETNTTGTFENLPAGNYELLLTDATGCTSSDNIIVTEPTVVAGTIIENAPVDCFGGNTGFVQAEAQGGTGTYIYTLGTQTNNSGIFLDLGAGDYIVTIVDENDCLTTVDVSVSQPSEIESEIVDIQNIECADVDGVGSVQVQASGGTGNFQYTLGTETNGFGVFENLPAGTYEVQIMDANGCSGMQSFDIAVGANLDIQVVDVEVINCFGEANGSIQVSAQGGTGSYEFVLGTTSNSTGYFDNLNSGIYSIIVIDGEGCESTMEYEVTQPEVIEPSLFETSAVACFGESNGSLNVTGQGGDGNYTYSLNSQNDAAGVFTDLAAGDYFLVITDGNGCSTSLPVTIDEPQAVDVNVVESIAVSCYGADDGMIQINGTGGIGNYIYNLGLETNASGTFENLPGGIYTLMVTDENDCSATSEWTIVQPEAIQTEVLELQAIGCGGNLFGAAQVGASGGTGALEYTLAGQTNTTGNFDNLLAGDYTVEVTDENGCSAPISFSIIESGELEAEVMANTSASCFGESDGTIEVSVTSGAGTYTYTLGTESNTSGVFSNLSAGNFAVDINDGGGCNTSVSFTIDQPAVLIAEAIELQPLTCFEANDAVIQLEAFGGNSPYVFTLNNETNTFGGFENLSAGIYEALITDQNNCSVTLEVVIIEPDAIQTDILENQEPACHGDSDGLLQLEAQGGNFPYEYTLGAETNTSGFFDNLSAGNYQVLITDANGCSSTETISLSQPSVLISGVLNINPVLCYGGDDAVIFIGADGGTPGYQFELNGEVNGGGVFFDLSAGPYVVNVTDANACSSQATVVVSQPNELSLDASNTQDDTGSGNGSVALDADGGVAPYLFSLDGVDYTVSGTFEGLSVGTYTAYVKDSNGCITQITFTIEMGTYISNPDQGVSDIQLFPNPFSNELQLQVELINAQDLELRMYTIHGQELFFYQAEFGAGETSIDLDIPNDLPAGAYIFSIKNEAVHLGHYKLVKQQ